MNHLYNFFIDQQEFLNPNLFIIHDITAENANYFRLALNTPGTQNINFDNKDIIILDEHLSVFANTQGYHYTITLKHNDIPLVLHVYFLDNKDVTDPILSKKSSKKGKNHPWFKLTEQSKHTIKDLALLYVSRIMPELIATQKSVITNLTAEYQNAIAVLRNNAFFASEKIEENLHYTNLALSLLERLDKLDKHNYSREIRRLIAYKVALQEALNCASEITQTITSEIIEPDSNQDCQTADIIETTQCLQDCQLVTHTAISPSADSYHELNREFEECALLLESKPQTFLDKVSLAQELHVRVTNLYEKIFFKAPDSKEQFIALSFAIENLLQNKNEYCLQVLKEILFRKEDTLIKDHDSLAPNLKDLIPLLPPQTFGITINTDNHEQLRLLIEHSNQDINNLTGKIRSLTMPLICLAFELKKHECFKLLFNEFKADAFVLYKDGLPLMVSMLSFFRESFKSLDIVSFRQALNYYPDISYEGRFYKRLMMAIQCKINDPAIDETRRIRLLEELRLYTQNYENSPYILNDKIATLASGIYTNWMSAVMEAVFDVQKIDLQFSNMNQADLNKIISCERKILIRFQKEMQYFFRLYDERENINLSTDGDQLIELLVQSKNTIQTYARRLMSVLQRENEVQSVSEMGIFATNVVDESEESKVAIASRI